jgi:(2Fe-2S) ferredoxin
LYGNVTAADVCVIFDEHLLGGQPVERLKMPADIW